MFQIDRRKTSVRGKRTLFSLWGFALAGRGGAERGEAGRHLWVVAAVGEGELGVDRWGLGLDCLLVGVDAKGLLSSISCAGRGRGKAPSKGIG